MKWRVLFLILKKIVSFRGIIRDREYQRSQIYLILEDLRERLKVKRAKRITDQNECSWRSLKLMLR